MGLGLTVQNQIMNIIEPKDNWIINIALFSHSPLTSFPRLEIQLKPTNISLSQGHPEGHPSQVLRGVRTLTFFLRSKEVGQNIARTASLHDLPIGRRRRRLVESNPREDLLPWLSALVGHLGAGGVDGSCGGHSEMGLDVVLDLIYTGLYAGKRIGVRSRRKCDIGMAEMKIGGTERGLYAFSANFEILLSELLTIVLSWPVGLTTRLSLLACMSLIPHSVRAT